MIATTAGALFYRRWFSRELIDARFVDAIVLATVAVIAGKVEFPNTIQTPLADHGQLWDLLPEQKQPGRSWSWKSVGR